MLHKHWDKNKTELNDVYGKCRLGINEKTGRLQWCPGHKYVKMLVAVPAALLPIILITMIVSHLNVVSTMRQEQPYDYPESVVQEKLMSDEQVEPLNPNCIPMEFVTNEALTEKERDPLKVYQTAFVPPDNVIIPSSCSEIQSEVHPQGTAAIYDLLARIRRALNETLLDREEPSSKQDEAIVSNGSTPIKLTEFWRNEGSREQILSIQSEIMQRYMDTSADPCDDFYQYACGNWDKINPIPKDKAAYDTFELLRENLDTILQQLLSEPIDTITNYYIEKTEKIRFRRMLRPKKPRSSVRDSSYDKFVQMLVADDPETKAKNLYKSCMNYELLEERGISPLLDLLQELGGWPVLDPNWDENNFDWLNLTARLRLYNNDVLLSQWVGPDMKQSDEYVIQFDQSNLGLPTRDFFLHESNAIYLDAYVKYIITVIELLSDNSTNAVVAANEIVNFEKQLAEIIAPAEDRVNVSKLYRRMTLSELQEEIPKIDWEQYLTILLDRTISSNEPIILFATNYMKDLVGLIESSKPRTVSNYLLWRFVRHRVSNLDDRFQDAKQKFYFALFGREESPPRWKNCVGHVNSNMGMAVGAMFVRRYFDENSKKDTLEMTHALQEAFREIINRTKWIDVETRLLAEQKVNHMSLRIGYPDFILSREEMHEKYEDLDIDPDKYFENTLNCLQRLTKTELVKVGKAVDKSTWDTAPAVVNAYYSRNKNQIMFPAGILQPPFYHRYFPKSLNFGGIGVVIGHELTHGFDDKGRLFDQHGNLHKWWSESAIVNFHHRSACLVKQYSNYVIPEVNINLNGGNTQGENIADNGGAKQAFHAYQKWLSEHSDPEELKRERLPGINATHNQLFFINFAQVWCGAMRPEALRNKMKTAVHSPGRFRVIGTLQNSEDFAREFQCAQGSNMNPVEKCTIW